MDKNCSICQTLVLPEEAVKTCEKCRVKFHLDCWNDRGGCATTGCEVNPSAIKTHNGQSLQDTYWGSETKTCPMCGESVKASDLKCPYCGEKFDSTQPITPEEIRKRFVRHPEKIKENKGAVTIFVCGLLGVTAPFNLLLGGLWYGENKKKLQSLSPIHNLLAIAGLSISGFYVLLMMLAIILAI